MALKYNASLKYSGAHDAPWLTVESDNEEELHAALSSLGAPDTDLWAALGRAIGAFKTGALLGEVLGAQAAPQAPAPQWQGGNVAPPAWAAGPSQPAGGFTAPPGAQPAGALPPELEWCEHGERRVFRSGVSQKGNTYAGYYCPRPNRNEQCAPKYPQR